MTSQEADDLIARLYERYAGDDITSEAMEQAALHGRVRVHFDGEKLVVLNPFRGCTCGDDHE